MIPLLELPDEVARANFNATKSIFELFEKKSNRELGDVIVTKSHDGEALSYFGDEVWDFSAYVDRKISTKNKLFFSEISSESLAIEMKLICFAWVYAAGSARKQVNIKPSTIFSRFSKLRFIYKYLERRGFETVEKLSNPMIFEGFCEYIKNHRFSMRNIGLILNSLAHIARLSQITPINFSMPLIGYHTTLQKRLCAPESLDQKNQFYAIPTTLMEKLYRHCIDEVNRYHEYGETIHQLLVDLRENYEIGKKNVDDKIESGIWNWITRDSKEYRVEINKHKPYSYSEIIDAHLDGHPLSDVVPRKVTEFYGWIAEVQINCFIICAAFTGMRRSEVYSIHPNSFKSQEINSQTFYTVESTYHKMTQGTGKTAEWVTTPFTKKAIELAEALSRHMRHQLLLSEKPLDNNNASCLWLGQRYKSELPKIRTEGNMRAQFNKIARKSEMLITEDSLREFELINPNCNPLHAEQKIKVGNLWPITTHQFRRTFAVFAKRHTLCSSIAIKQQFKHLDLPTTEWYGEGGIAAKLNSLHLDKELRNLLDEVQLEFKTQKIFHWYNSSEKLYGRMGTSIQRERSEIPVIFKSWETINKQLRDGRLNLVGTLHSYCLAGYECSMNKIVSPSSCIKCENLLIDTENGEKWKARHLWCVKTLIDLHKQGSLSQSTYSHFITQIRAAEKVLKYFNIEFQPLPKEINING